MVNDIWIALHILKITFETVQHVQNCIYHSLLLDWVHVPSYNVKRDDVVNVTVCNHCLMFEDHVSSKCPQKANNPQFHNVLYVLLLTTTIATVKRRPAYFDACLADVTTKLKHSKVSQYEI